MKYLKKKKNNDYPLFSHIQNWADNICDKHNTMHVKFHKGYFMDDNLVGNYESHPLPKIYLNYAIDFDNVNLHKRYSAYHRLKDKISKEKYIMYHELFHHISLMSDGFWFERKLYKFIKQHENI